MTRTIVHSDDPNYIQRLNQEAAKALADGVRAGIPNLSEAVAWEWLSRNPAKALNPDLVLLRPAVALRPLVGVVHVSSALIVEPLSLLQLLRRVHVLEVEGIPERVGVGGLPPLFVNVFMTLSAILRLRELVWGQKSGKCGLSLAR